MGIDNIRTLSIISKVFPFIPIYPHLSPLIPINLHQVKWKNINPHQSVLIPIAHLSNKSCILTWLLTGYLDDKNNWQLSLPCTNPPLPDRLDKQGLLRKVKPRLCGISPFKLNHWILIKQRKDATKCHSMLEKWRPLRGSSWAILINKQPQDDNCLIPICLEEKSFGNLF